MADWGDQEQLSLAYVTAVAAAAGCVCEPSYRGMDNAGVDLRIFPREYRGDRFQLNLQVKSKQVRGSLPTGSISMALSCKQYEDLRYPIGGIPLLLVVVLIPAERTEWIRQTADEMILRRCGYWLSLRGLPSAATRSRQLVRVPLSQVFEPGVLRSMISSIKSLTMPG